MEGERKEGGQQERLQNTQHICNLSPYTHHQPEGGDSPPLSLSLSLSLPPDGISNSCTPPSISTGGRVLSLRVALSEAKHRRVAGCQTNPLGNTCRLVGCLGARAQANTQNTKHKTQNHKTQSGSQTVEQSNSQTTREPHSMVSEGG